MMMLEKNQNGSTSYVDDDDFNGNENAAVTHTHRKVGSQPCRSVSQGVVDRTCLPKTAWPPTLRRGGGDEEGDDYDDVRKELEWFYQLC